MIITYFETEHKGDVKMLHYAVVSVFSCSKRFTRWIFTHNIHQNSLSETLTEFLWEGSEVYECRQFANLGIFLNKIILCNNQIWQTHQQKSSKILDFHALVNSHLVMNEFKYKNEHQPALITENSMPPWQEMYSSGKFPCSN